MVLLNTKVVAAKSIHTATVFILHGLGDSWLGWEPVARQLSSLPQFSHIKFVLPNAPRISISVNMGMQMQGWYDIYSMDKKINARQDAEGIKLSSEALKELVAHELESNTELTRDRIVIGGFSQGAAVSLYTAITTTEKIGGVFSLSGYLPVSLEDKNVVQNQDKNMQIFFGHGLDDPIVPEELGQISSKYFKDAGFQNLEYHSYPDLEHGATQEEVMDLAAWFRKVLPAEYEK